MAIRLVRERTGIRHARSMRLPHWPRRSVSSRRSLDLLVVQALLRRTSALQRLARGNFGNRRRTSCPSASERLERDALLVSRPYADRPPRAACQLTAEGMELAGALRLLATGGPARRSPLKRPVHPTCRTPLEAEVVLPNVRPPALRTSRRWICTSCSQVRRSQELSSLTPALDRLIDRPAYTKVSTLESEHVSLFLSVVFRSVVVCQRSGRMTATEPLSGDARGGASGCDLGGAGPVVDDGTAVSDAARIDRIARLEKLRAGAPPAVQAAESSEVRPVSGGGAARRRGASRCHRAWHRRTDAGSPWPQETPPSVAARRLSDRAGLVVSNYPDTYRQLTSGELNEPDRRAGGDPNPAPRPATARPRRPTIDRRRRQAGVQGGDGVHPKDRLPGGSRRLCAAGPHRTHNIAASASGRHQTPWPCSPAISRSNKASPATPHSAPTPIPPSPTVTGRTRDQIIADTMVERITGQTRATDINIELQLMMPLTLINPDDRPRPNDHP